MRKSLPLLALTCVMLAGCVAGASAKQDSSGNLPAMRWDHRPEATDWTRSSMNFIAKQDAVLAGRIPSDIERFCPGYEEASLNERRAFWAGLLSATAKHESTWNPRASGAGGRYIGLLQISPRTAQGYNCSATSAEGLKNGEANLACAVKIMSKQIGRDGVVAGEGNRGIGRDWGPFRSASKRSDIAAWTKKQSYCQG